MMRYLHSAEHMTSLLLRPCSSIWGSCLYFLISLDQYLSFDSLPHSSGGWHQRGSQRAHLLRETSFRAEVTTGQRVKDFVNGGVGGQSAVKHTELAFESLGDVITTTTGMDHSSHQLQVDDADEFPRPFQAVETSLLHQLTNNLICDLRYAQQ